MHHGFIKRRIIIRFEKSNDIYMSMFLLTLLGKVMFGFVKLLNPTGNFWS